MQEQELKNKIEWNNGLASRKRSAWLLFVNKEQDRVIPFLGKDIPNVAIVKGYDSEQCGVWSSCSFRLVMTDGWKTIAGHDGFETNTFQEGLAKSLGLKDLDTWSDIALALDVSVVACMEFIRAWRPQLASKLDAIDAAIDEIEKYAPTSKIMHIHFGGPTNRMIDEGFWVLPKDIPGIQGGEVYLIDKTQGWKIGNVGVRGISGTVLNVKTASGRGGGYVSVCIVIEQS